MRVRAWFSLAVLVAVCLGLTASARATTYYVEASAKVGGDGTTLAKAWRTIALANASVAEGDLVRIYPGVYADVPNPAAVSAAGGYFYFNGDISHPEWVTITGANLTKTYTSIAGVNLSNGLSVSAGADNDSLSSCLVNGPLDIENASYGTAVSCKFNGTYTWIDGSVNAALEWAGHIKGWNFITCTWPHLGAGDGITTNLFNIKWADSLWFYRNTFDLYPSADLLARGQNEFIVYHSIKPIFRNCKITFHTPAGLSFKGLVFRDSTYNSEMHVDTLLEFGTGVSEFLPSASGSYGSSVYGGLIDSSYIKLRGDPAVNFQNRLDRQTFVYNTVLSSGGIAFAFCGMQGRCEVGNNDFCGWLGYSDPNWGQSIVNDISGMATWRNYLYFHDNIVYSWPPPYDGDVVWRKFPVLWNLANFDSARAVNDTASVPAIPAAGQNTVQLISDHNLYSYFGHSTRDTVGDKNISWWRSVDGYHWTKPGGTRNWTLRWCPGCDDSSTYGSPRFARGGPDSTWDSFDPRIGALSAARGAGTGGADIGAVAYAAFGKIAVYPTALAFEDGTDVATQTRVLNISNLATGTVNLAVSAITCDLPEVSFSGTTATIAQSGFTAITVTYTPSGSDVKRLGTITITSDDPNYPTYTIPVAVNQGPTKGGSQRKDLY